MVAWGVVAVPAPASAHQSGTVVLGGFEVEGDRADDAVAGIDWATPPPNVTTFPDITGKGDDVFGRGSKELEPGGWKCISGSAPGKDDVFQRVPGEGAGAISFDTVGGKQFLYVNFTRAGVNGDAHVDYEFNQSTQPNASCPSLPRRTGKTSTTPGDVVITFDTENGGKDIFVRAFEWVGSATAGTFQPLTLGSHGTTFDGSVNIPNTIPQHIAGDFGEAALNLTDTIGTFECNEFAKVHVKSRASTAINSELKDRTAPQRVDPGNCPRSEAVKAVRNVTDGGRFGTGPVVADPGETLEWRVVYNNTGSSAATNVVVTDPLQNGQNFDAFTSCPVGHTCTYNTTTKTVTWRIPSAPAGSTFAMTFTVVLDSTFNPGQTQVCNTASVSSDQEPTTPTQPTTCVTVVAEPSTNPVKAVRNETTNGQFGTTTNASPGDVIEYRITATNLGKANATGVVLRDSVREKSTWLSCTPTCTRSPSGGTAPGTALSWNVGTLAPGASAVVTFRTRLDATFPAGTTEIVNVATVTSDRETTPKPSNQTTVRVSATPALSLAKSVVNDSNQTVVRASVGDVLTYHLDYFNNGSGTATNVVITDPLPPGTRFESCTTNVSGPGTSCGYSAGTNTVTWTIGTVPAKTGGRVTFTVTVTSIVDPVGCQLCNTGFISSPDQGGGAAIPSNQVCIELVPLGDPDGANASGSATGAALDGRILPAGDDPAPDTTSADSSQSGVGSTPESKEQLNVDVPPGPPTQGSILHADVLRASTRSSVTEVPEQADALSAGSAVGVSILGGTVQAKVVVAVANATTTGSSSFVSSNGSAIEGPVLVDQNGPDLPGGTLEVQSVAPNMSAIPLNSTVFGADSFVKIYERIVPSAGNGLFGGSGLQGGTYRAAITVNMIHVVTTGGLVGPHDIIVAQAVAASDFPQTTVCGNRADQSVSGHAFVVKAVTDPSLLPVTVGYVEIPSNGGNSAQHVNSVSLANVSTKQADSSSTGVLTASASTASSFAEVATVCLFASSPNNCTVSAKLVRAQSNSSASGAGASSNATGSQLVDVVVNGMPIAANAPANTTIALPGGVATVIINEQICDNSDTAIADPPLDPPCQGGDTGATGMTVRSLHVILLKPGAAPALAEVIVAEAHSDATFR